MFENNICVDLPDVLGGKPDCANSPLLGFFARARCPPCPSTLQSHSGQGVWLRREESSNIIFQTLLFLRLFPFFFFCFLLTIILVWLLGRIFDGSVMVFWTHLFFFYVTTDASWRILIRFGFWAYLCTKLSIFHSFCVCRPKEQLA